MPAYLETTVFVLIVCHVFIYVGETARSAKPIPGPLDKLVYPGEFGYSPEHEHNQHERHNHPEDEDYYDGTSSKPNNKKDVDDAISNIWNNQQPNRIPISLIKEINDNDYAVNDLLLHYVDDYDETMLSSRFGEERDGGVIAKEAKCMPELKSITLIDNTDPSVMYIPSCIRVNRCGGCCKHEMLSCQAKEMDTMNVKVIKVMYTGGKNLKYVEKQVVPVEVHNSCKCDCKIRPEDCKPMQVYEKSECRCICKNTDEEKKCLKENSTKLWNPNACSCQCREELMCTTGSVFDWRQCKCVVKQVRRRNAEVSRRGGYRSSALSVIPLSDEFF